MFLRSHITVVGGGDNSHPHIHYHASEEILFESRQSQNVTSGHNGLQPKQYFSGKMLKRMLIS